MSVCALVGAVGLLTGQAYGLVFALLAAGSLLLLALMDITFNIQNNLYRHHCISMRPLKKRCPDIIGAGGLPDVSGSFKKSPKIGGLGG